MSSPTKTWLVVLQVVAWIIFVGLCVEAGALLVNTFITLVTNPAGAKNFWEGGDYLYNLFQFDRGHFLVITTSMSIVAVLKAILFYLIVKLFSENQLNLSQPFSSALRTFMLRISYLALGIGLFCHFTYKYAGWLTKQGVEMPDMQALHTGGSDVWLFLAVILFVILQIVKRGVEIQSENELTV